MRLIECFFQASKEGFKYELERGSPTARTMDEWTMKELNNGLDYRYEHGQAIENCKKDPHIVIFLP